MNPAATQTRRKFLKISGVSLGASLSLVDLIPAPVFAEGDKSGDSNCESQNSEYHSPDASCDQLGDSDEACNQRLGDDEDQGCTARGTSVTTNEDGNCNNGSDPVREADPDNSCQPNSQRVEGGASGNEDESCASSQETGMYSPDNHCEQTLNLQNGATDPDNDGAAPHGPIPQCVQGFGEDAEEIVN